MIYLIQNLCFLILCYHDRNQKAKKKIQFYIRLFKFNGIIGRLMTPGHLFVYIHTILLYLRKKIEKILLHIGTIPSDLHT